MASQVPIFFCSFSECISKSIRRDFQYQCCLNRLSSVSSTWHGEKIKKFLFPVHGDRLKFFGSKKQHFHWMDFLENWLHATSSPLNASMRKENGPSFTSVHGDFIDVTNIQRCGTSGLLTSPLVIKPLYQPGLQGSL